MIDLKKLTKAQLNRINHKHPSVSIVALTPKRLFETPHQRVHEHFLVFNINSAVAYLEPDYQRKLYYGVFSDSCGGWLRIKPSSSFKTAIDTLVTKCHIYQVQHELIHHTQRR